MDLFMTDFWTYFIIILAVLGIIVWFWLESKYKHKVIIKDVVGGRVILKMYRAKDYTDRKDRTSWWKLAGEKNKERKLISLPPETAIELTHKAKKIAQCYRFETGEIVWIRDDWEILEPPKFELIPEDVQKRIDEEKDQSEKKNILETYKKKELDKWKRDNKVITPFQPVTTNQRMAYFQNIKKAESRKGFDWKEKIVPLAAMASLVMIVLCLMLFWGEIAKPVLEARQVGLQEQQMRIEQLNLLKEIKLGIQRIDNRQNNPESNSNLPN